jgi:hypothetical protein
MISLCAAIFFGFDSIPHEQVSVASNKSLSALRAFVLQGSAPVSLVHMACFGTASQRQQCILKGELLDAGLRAYLDAKRADSTSTYLVCTLEREGLSTIIRRESFKGMILKLTSGGYLFHNQPMWSSLMSYLCSVSAVAEAEVKHQGHQGSAAVLSSF